jgi:hypothetical protein
MESKLRVGCSKLAGHFFASALLAAQRLLVAAMIAALPAALRTRIFLMDFTFFGAAVSV